MTAKYEDRRGNGKIVQVVSREVDFGVSRKFEIINERKFGFDFQLFKSTGEDEN